MAASVEHPCASPLVHRSEPSGDTWSNRFGPFGASASARLPKGQPSGSERPGHHMLGLDEEDDPAGWLRVRTTGVQRRDPVDDRPGRFTVDPIVHPPTDHGHSEWIAAFGYRD